MRGIALFICRCRANSLTISLARNLTYEFTPIVAGAMCIITQFFYSVYTSLLSSYLVRRLEFTYYHSLLCHRLWQHVYDLHVFLVIDILLNYSCNLFLGSWLADLLLYRYFQIVGIMQPEPLMHQHGCNHIRIY